MAPDGSRYFAVWQSCFGPMEATVDREEALTLLKRGKVGVREWNRRRDGEESIPSLHAAVLIGAYLSKADLIGANFSGACLSGANLSGANLSGASLSGANLTEADLHWANLSDADLSAADLAGANLSGACLYGANLRLASLSEASFEKCECWLTVFADVDLSTVRGLNSVNHGGPSSVSVDTLIRSQDAIPEVFLRDCGIPDVWIANIPALISAMNPIQFYSCFISYSSKDAPFAQRLYADLQRKGVRCWFAPEDLEIGAKIRRRIDEVIRVHDKLLLILSKHSVESDWVEKEVETAMERERHQKRLVLFPIRLDQTVMTIQTGWPADIKRDRNIGDFRGWKSHDRYQKAFDRLLRDLETQDQ
jgi:hypothetical protein